MIVAVSVVASETTQFTPVSRGRVPSLPGTAIYPAAGRKVTASMATSIPQRAGSETFPMLWFASADNVPGAPGFPPEAPGASERCAEGPILGIGDLQG